jgi:hypothetical protein
MRVPAVLFLVLFSFFHFFSPLLFSSVIINEIMKDPVVVSDNDGEWFELHNVGGEVVDIGGWIIQDQGRDYHQIPADSGLTIPPGGYVVLGRNADPVVNGGYSPDYVYDGFTLSNGEDEILLLDASGMMIDSVAYDGANWPSDPGASMEFIEGREDNAVGENWLSSTVTYGDGDLGTPGGENSATGVGIGEGEIGGDRESDQDRPVFETYPNPFRGSTTIRMNDVPSISSRFQPSMRSESTVTLRIYDLHGKMVRDLWVGSPGNGSRIVWNGKDDRGVDLPPGVYIIRMTGPAGSLQRKVLFAGR